MLFSSKGVLLAVMCFLGFGGSGVHAYAMGEGPPSAGGVPLRGHGLPNAGLPEGLTAQDWQQVLAVRAASEHDGQASDFGPEPGPQPGSLTGHGTIEHQAYLKASNTGANDAFGWSIALSGDTLVVGAYLEDSNATGVNGNQANNSATNAGAAYVFVRTGETWTQQAYLKASNAGLGDGFGYSVAISGDTIVVGSINEDSAATGVNGNQANNSALGAGAAYVFVRSGATWSQQAYLKASNTNSNDFFGYSVAVSGDTLVVAAHLEDSAATGTNGNQTDNTATNAGAAYVFVRTGETWNQQAYLKASNTDAEDVFGFWVAISGDTLAISGWNEDSAATGVNGAQTDNSSPDSGAVYGFVRSGGGWSQQAYLKASNTGTNDAFGICLALSGDTLVVAASGEDGSATGVNGNQADDSAVNSGAAYVFVRDGENWSQQAYLKASNTQAFDLFARSVAISGDMLVVGAVGEDSAATGVNGNQTDNSASFSGAAYVFKRNGGIWSQEAYLKASNTGQSDGFGISVAIFGDTILGSASQEDSAATGVDGDHADNNAPESGAAYVFAFATASLLGDMNCNGAVSVGDIAGFVLALTNPTGYAAAYPDCDINSADVNESGNISVTDIGPFVQLLTGV